MYVIYAWRVARVIPDSVIAVGGLLILYLVRYLVGIVYHVVSKDMIMLCILRRRAN